jgi:hypothetical protein
MKKYFLFILAVFTISSNMAQSFDDEDLQRRYFLSRNRLKKWFVTANSGPGGGYPIENIKLYQEKFNYPFDKVLLKADKTDSAISNSAWNSNFNINSKQTEVSGTMVCDNPLIMLGEYLEVLSTEYWLMKHYGQTETEQFLAVKNEIYYALVAIDRLDGTAEPYFKELEDIKYNGFLRRDDSEFERLRRVNSHLKIDAGYVHGILQQANMNNIEGPTPDTGFLVYEQHKKFITTIKLKDSTIYDSTYVNGNLVIDTSIIGIYKDSFNITSTTPYHKYYRNNYRISRHSIADPEREDGDFNNCAGRFENEMSMDELIGLMMGLRYVQRFVDENETAKPTVLDSQKSIVPWTRVIADRFMVYLSAQTTDIRYLQPADYRERQQWACVKDRKGRKAYKRVKDKVTTIETECAECGDYDIYTQYTAEIGHGQVYNPVLFKTGNYVLTNPAANGRHVQRGPFAFPFGAGFERLGEKLASSSGNSKDYPGVSMELDDEENFLRLASDLGLSETLYNLALPVALVYWPVDHAIGEKGAIWDKITIELTGRCVLTNTLGIDATSLCLTSSMFRPDEPWWWRTIWDKLGDSTTVINKLWLKYGNESGSPNVMAAKLAASNGDWDKGNFAHFAEKCGFPMMSLQYDILNEEYPVLSKSYFQQILNTMDCFADKGTEWPFDRDILGGHAMVPSERNTNNYNNGIFDANTGFLLYYNLYRIADILYWENNLKNYSDNSCPCFLDSFHENKKMPFSVIAPERVVHSITNSSGDPVWDIYFSYKDKKKQIVSEYKTRDANPTHSAISVRQHEYLNHYYELGNNQKFGVTRDLVICNAQMNCKSGGEIFIDTAVNHDSPNELVIRKNGELVLNNNSILRVNPYSKTVIEAGGRLTYKTGARIILNGPNAVLHIKGKLVLAPGAEFKIEGGSLGKGYVIWDNGNGSPHYGLAELDAGTGSSMLFEQTNNTQVALKVEGVNGLNTTDKLYKITVKNCRVEVGPASRLLTEAVITDFNNVKVFGFLGSHPNPEFDYKITANGVHQLGRKNNYKNVEFNNCANGLSYLNLGGALPLDMEDVTFNNCLNGIVNRGGRIRYNHGALNSVQHNGTYVQLRNGITGIGTQGASHINDINAGYPHWWFTPLYHPLASNQSTKNMQVHGNGGMYIYKSTIQSADYGVQMDQAGIHPICTDFYDNATQAMHTNFSRFTAINNSYNQMHWSANVTAPRTAFFGYMGYLYLNNGANRIYGHNNGNPFVFESLAPDQAVVNSSDPNLWNNKAIPATGNQWQVSPYVATYPASGYNAVVELGGFTPFYIDINKVPYKTGNWDQDQDNYCASYRTPFDPPGTIPPYLTTGLVSNGNHADEVERTLPIKSGQLGDIITANGGDGTAYANTLKRVLVKMNDTVKDYNDVIDTLRSLFLTPVPDTIAAGVKHIYSLLQDLYVEVRTDSNIASSAQEAVETAVFDNMLQLQNQLLNLSNDTGSIWRFAKFELVRDKALIYRVFNQRNEGINWLNNNIANWDEGTEKVALVEWNCLINLEQLYIDSVITYDSLTRGSCLQPFTIPEFEEGAMIQPIRPLIPQDVSKAIEDWMQPNTMNSTDKNGVKSNVILYPNPAEDAVFVASKLPITNIIIRETNGRLLYHINAQNLQVIKIDATGLVRGMYLVEIYNDKHREVRTLVINR